MPNQKTSVTPRPGTCYRNAEMRLAGRCQTLRQRMSRARPEEGMFRHDGSLHAARNIHIYQHEGGGAHKDVPRVHGMCATYAEIRQRVWVVGQRYTPVAKSTPAACDFVPAAVHNVMFRPHIICHARFWHTALRAGSRCRVAGTYRPQVFGAPDIA